MKEYERLTERRETPLVMSMWGGTSKELKIYNRLAELEDDLESGKMIRLPCKVGDTVWFIPLYGGNPYCGIREDKIQVVGISSRGFHLKLREHHDHNKTYYLGKTVFLTKAEAENKLKELKGE